MIDAQDKHEAPAEPSALHGRWTISAMLIVATTIHYVDRSVLSILKPYLHGQVIHLQPLIPGWPTVTTTINLTDQQYGYVLAAFQIAYALGVVFAGRLVDRVGCRIGYPLVTGLWSLAAMAHALFPRPWRERKLSRGHQGHGRVVPAARTRARHGHFQFGGGRRRYSCAARRALGRDPLRLARFVPHDGPVQRTVDRVVVDPLQAAA